MWSAYQTVRNGGAPAPPEVKGLVLSANISSSVEVPFGSGLDSDQVFYTLNIKRKSLPETKRSVYIFLSCPLNLSVSQQGVNIF